MFFFTDVAHEIMLYREQSGTVWLVLSRLVQEGVGQTAKKMILNFDFDLIDQQLKRDERTLYYIGSGSI